MTDRPIIFSSEIVKAILDGRKTQTRRPIKPQPDKSLELIGMSFSWAGKAQAEFLTPTGYHTPLMYHPLCPYGQPGDRLWVRETFYKHKHIGMKFADEYENLPSNSQAEYRKSPAIFMPKYIARITLEIVVVKVERLQEITEEDAQAEGCLNDVKLEYGQEGGPIDYRGLYAVERFEQLWNSLYTKKPEYQWQANPWAWVIEFKMEEMG